MTASAHNPAALDLTREEAWVVHAAVLAAIERELDDGNDAPDELALLRALEADDGFEPDQLRLLRRILSQYLTDAPDRDDEPGRSVLDDIELALS
ncbi:DUF7853 family protein [Halegenticoccus soli]|uniref:DUF7853 family protein n=1 Tax=Halegenticoccus soli TaxID=1985678 RepID=UPI000C6D770B|nr:hypothetical protein [Halegenticoccus soli]